MDCYSCYGNGEVECPECQEKGYLKEGSEACHHCHGEGSVSCHRCCGNGALD